MSIIVGLIINLNNFSNTRLKQKALLLTMFLLVTQAEDVANVVTLPETTGLAKAGFIVKGVVINVTLTSMLVLILLKIIRTL